jgi:hypothetical protein
MVQRWCNRFQQTSIFDNKPPLPRPLREDRKVNSLLLMRVMVCCKLLSLIGLPLDF